jgi:hypothetical protein
MSRSPALGRSPALNRSPDKERSSAMNRSAMEETVFQNKLQSNKKSQKKSRSREMWENMGFLVLKYFTRENPYSSKQRFSSLNRSSGLFCVTNETGKELLE